MSNIEKQALTLKERIEKALSDFTKGRASMHVPPLDTDVDMVLADCLTALEKLEATAAQANAGWKEAHEQEARAEAAEKRIAELRELLQWAHDTLLEINPNNYTHDDVCEINSASVEVILGIAPVLGETHGKSEEWWAARAAGTAKGE
ncbi:hypothetical protein [Citrobacter freundii]